MKITKKAITFAALISMLALASCSRTESNSVASSNSGNSSSIVDDSDGALAVRIKGDLYEPGEYSLNLSTKDNVVAFTYASSTGESEKVSYKSSDETVLTISSTGKVSVLKAGSTTITVSYAGANATIVFNVTVTDPETSSKGVSFTGVSYDEKSRILAALEKYAVDNYLTGITIFSNGSKIAYNTRYVPQPQSYISGYGWGTTREGVLNGTLAGGAMSGKDTYYNIGTISLPAHANAMNASGSDVSTIYDYIACSYYSTRMNQTADGYEWYPVLATDDKPIAVEEPTQNADGSINYGAVIPESDARHNSNRRWRIHLRNDVQYRTGSNNSFTKTYDHKKISLEDYITPLKFMLTQWNGQYRGSELTDGISGFTGAATYFSKTAKRNASFASDAIYDDASWDSLMGTNIFTGTDSTGDFIEFNLLESCTSFYAMYYLSSSLYSPLPESFIKHWGGTTLGKSDSNQGVTSLDTMLSVGPYYIENWSASVINFKHNDDYFYKEDVFKDDLTGTQTRKVYNLDGISYNYVGSSSELLQNFLSGKIDSYAPTAEELKKNFTTNSGNGTATGVEWRLYETKGDSNFKLNVNASSETDWLKRFGKGQGTVAQVDGSTTTWTALNKDLNNQTPQTACKPYMNNIHFLNFLSASINRKELCEARGSVPTQEYFSDNYLIDPENGISYNSTDAHKAVLADRYNETYGFNATYAKSELKKAFEEVISPLGTKGAFNSKNGGSHGGTSSNPYIVPIDMEWMNTSDRDDYNDVFTYVKQYFNEVSEEEYGGMYELSINETGGNSDYQAVYTLMKQGQFDLGFGAISGNALNPLNFVEVLKSDNSSGFTLNWGPDTGKIGSGLYSGDDSKNYIVYNGKKWSYDGLWAAADKGVALDNNGENVVVKNASSGGAASGTAYQSVNASNQSITYKLSFKQFVEAGATAIKFRLSNSSAEDGWQTYVVIGNAGAGETKLDLDNNDCVTVTVDNRYNTSEGTTDSDNNITLTVTYTVELDSYVDGDSGLTASKLSKEFNDSISLLTYAGYLEASK